MIISVEQVYKHYQNPGSQRKREVLCGISLSIKPGDSLAITGPSGSGKTTLLNLLGTLDQPSKGAVLFDNQEVNGLGDNQLAEIRNKHIGFVFQQHYLLPQLTLLENMLVPVIAARRKYQQEKYRQRAMSLLQKVGLEDHLSHLPAQLSGGECQRAAVVRALINEPDILLADEPTGSLDKEASELLGELLTQMNKDLKVSLVTVTHSDSLAQKMGRIYQLENGRFTQPRGELNANNGI